MRNAHGEVVIFFIFSLDIIQLLWLRQSDSKGFLGWVSPRQSNCSAAEFFSEILVIQSTLFWRRWLHWHTLKWLVQIYTFGPYTRAWVAREQGRASSLALCSNRKLTVVTTSFESERRFVQLSRWEWNWIWNRFGILIWPQFSVANVHTNWNCDERCSFLPPCNPAAPELQEPHLLRSPSVTSDKDGNNSLVSLKATTFFV